MKKKALYFCEPFRVELSEEEFPLPVADLVAVKTIYSAISAGTELLVFRNQWPDHTPIDATIAALSGKFKYPLKYGYSCVGKIIEVGPEADQTLLGRLVFSFNPHESHFLARANQLILLPDSVSPEDAVFLPNMETAVSLVMDGKPMIGERVAIFGQGIVGLLTAALLVRFPLADLVSFEPHLLRRKKSLLMGVHRSVGTGPESMGIMQAKVQDESAGFDLVYELSGNPGALNQALEVAGFSGRLVVGSWYGEKKSEVALGGRFHRGRLRLISSQVSRLDPQLTGLWTKNRRMDTALRMIEEVVPSRLISHRFHISRCREAFDLLHEHPESAIQVIFTYEDTDER